MGIVCLLFAGSGLTADAQTEEKGPWWPHPLWGAGDQAGGSNWITPEKVIESLNLVKTGKIYEIGQVYEFDGPGHWRFGKIRGWPRANGVKVLSVKSGRLPLTSG